jgi:hypothetical protein
MGNQPSKPKDSSLGCILYRWNEFDQKHLVFSATFSSPTNGSIDKNSTLQLDLFLEGWENGQVASLPQDSWLHV